MENILFNNNSYNKEIIAILDAGSQYGKLIDRCIRELKVETELLPFNTPIEILNKNYKGIIISGGPESVYSIHAPIYDKDLFLKNEIPILGICYGMQLMNYVFPNGKIERKTLRQDGQQEVFIETSSILFNNLSPLQKVLLTHGDIVTEVANDFRIISTAVETKIICGIENKNRKLYGLQFHPEVNLTINGKQIFYNFLYKICGVQGLYTMEDREKKAIEFIQRTVKDKKVFALVSGGVDSTVCAVLLNKAIGNDNVYSILIDTGFMRKNESKNVKEALENLGIKLHIVNAKDYFYNSTSEIQGKKTLPLSLIVNPEEKRKIIGDTFIKVAEKEINKLGLNLNDIFLAQGTLRPDLIESASQLVSLKANTIKTHHNDTKLVRDLREQGKIIEPLKDYHKDEVRELGIKLGLPYHIVWRQPFPGPGLAIRIICAEKPFIDSTFEETNNILQLIIHYLSNIISNDEENDFFMKKMNFYNLDNIKTILNDLKTNISNPIHNNIYATLLPIQTVGVQGDGRTYSYIAALSGTKHWNDLFTLSKIIPKICHNINRVIYIFGEATKKKILNVTPTYLTEETINQLQIADDIVNNILMREQLINKLSQVPVILFPIDFDSESLNSNKRSIAIRTFITNDFMTGTPAIPGIDINENILDEIIDKILKETPNISRVAYDLTSKPPGTTEWE